MEDISNFGRVLDIIIDHRGCVVPDYNLRTGRRYVSLRDEEVVLKQKPRDCQRKTTLSGLTIPIHHDCNEAYLRLDRSEEIVHNAVDEVYLDIVEVDEFLGESSTGEEELADVEEMMNTLDIAEDYSAVV